MDKWVININNKEIVFADFDKAISLLLKTISKHFVDHSYVHRDSSKVVVYDSACMPDNIGTYFHGLYYDRTITDEEIILETRLNMLLSYLACDNLALLGDNALKSINKSYEYHNEEVAIKINHSLEEIEVYLSTEDNDSYLYTNIFIMEDKDKQYFFKTHQVCHTSNRRRDIGKTVDLNIALKRKD